MSFETIKFEKTGAVATVTLDRPEAANSLNLAMGNDLLAAANICSSDPSIRAVILMRLLSLLKGARHPFCVMHQEVGWR